MNAVVLSYEDLAEGQEESWSYEITPELYSHFMAAFDDRSPVHVDEAVAVQRGFAGRVMHGGMLHGFLSHFVGMVFPGANSLLLSADLRYLKPSYMGDALTLRAKVAQKVDAARVVVLHVVMKNDTQGGVSVASGKVQVKVVGGSSSNSNSILP